MLHLKLASRRNRPFPSPRALVGLFVCLAVSILVERVSAQFQLPSTVQLPTFGVSIDADGVLETKMFAEPGGRLFAERILAARRRHAPEFFEASELRKISLPRLERAIAERLAAGEPLDDDMLKLAGLTRVQYLFVDPETNELIIAGPAEGWIEDSSGRAVGTTSGRPIVLLEDLLTALRTFSPHQPRDVWVGCTIDPTQEGLRRLTEFQSTIPSRVSQRERDYVGREVAVGMRESLGLADVRVFGLSPNTHMANVLVEADYRMKLIGIGLEPPPVEMATFLSASTSGQHQVLQRWWFTPDYECVKVTPDGLAMELVGQGVQLLSEEFDVAENGRLEQADRNPSRASRLYTQAFTRKYPKIAEQSPVYAQLRNMIDVLVLAAYIRRESVYENAGWAPGLLLDEEQIPVETHTAPTQAACVSNAVWKGNRLIAPAGGGVSILPSEAFLESNLIPDTRGRLETFRSQQTWDTDPETWWWD